MSRHELRSCVPSWTLFDACWAQGHVTGRVARAPSLEGGGGEVGIEELTPTGVIAPNLWDFTKVLRNFMSSPSDLLFAQLTWWRRQLICVNLVNLV